MAEHPGNSDSTAERDEERVRHDDSAIQRPRIVIAGGSGFIGRRLCAVLGGSGHDVVVLTRTAGRVPVGPISFAHWDPDNSAGASTQGWAEHLEGAAAVVNLSGESIGGPRWTDARKARLITSRVEPSRALVQAVNASAQPPALLIQASGVGYYGTGNEPVDESGASGADFLADLARQWEAPLGDLREDVRPVVARLGVVLGKGGGALAQMLVPFRLFVGGPIASGNQWLSWIHLHDAVGLIVELIESSTSSGIFNLVAPNPVRNIEFSKAVANALGRPSWMFTPRVVLKALLGEQSTLVCDGQQTVSMRLADHTFAYPDIDAALAELI